MLVIQNTQELKENAKRSGQNMRIFEEVLFFQATENIKIEEKIFLKEYVWTTSPKNLRKGILIARGLNKLLQNSFAEKIAVDLLEDATT